MENTNINDLLFLNELVKELAATNASNEKIEILKKYHDKDGVLFKKWMQYIYDYDIIYWVTSSNLIKLYNKEHNKTEFDSTKTIFELLDPLIERKITGHSAIFYLNDLIDHYILLNTELNKELFYKIIDKDMGVNTGIALINKAVAKTIKTFNVALAETFEKTKDSESCHYIDLNTQKWCCMQKLDGCRCITIFNERGISFWSRQGKKFYTLDNLKPYIEKLDIKNKYVLDGEVCIIDENGKESFQDIMKGITRKDYTIEKPVYILFDLIPYEDFFAKKSKETYRERFNKLKKIIDTNSTNLKIVPNQYDINQNDLSSWLKKSETNSWEGLMLRNLESQYEGKRSFNLIKYKLFKDAEYIVEDIEIGTKPFLVEGVMVEKECVAALVINHIHEGVGYKVKVGSGLSNEQRLEWYKDKTKIIGKEITVQYFEETLDENNTWSLRFPTLKFVYENGRET